MMTCAADSTSVHQWPAIKGLLSKYLEDGDSVYNDASLTDDQKADKINHLTNTFGM